MEAEPAGSEVPETPLALPKSVVPTAGATAFDVIFGIALPIVCIVADPGILRGRHVLGPEILRTYAAGAYALILPAIAVIAVSLLRGGGGLLLAGPLLVGGCGALAIGLALLPLSLPMSLLGIGLLGLVPFATAFTFFRGGLRALSAARKAHPARVVAVVVSLLALASAAVPIAAQGAVDRRTRAALEAAISGEAVRETDAVERLRPVGWLADPSTFLEAWNASTDEARRERLDRVWRDATGHYLTTGFD